MDIFGESLPLLLELADPSGLGGGGRYRRLCPGWSMTGRCDVDLLEGFGAPPPNIPVGPGGAMCGGIMLSVIWFMWWCLRSRWSMVGGGSDDVIHGK